MKLFLILLFVSPIFLNAQNLETFKIYDHKKQEGNNLRVYAENGLISLTAVKHNVIKLSFLTLSELNPISNIDKEIYVRVTQNLDDIFMQTDSLLIIINKIDFSIKFENLRGKIYLAQKTFRFDSNNDTIDFLTKTQQSFYLKNRELKEKKYKFSGSKIIQSDKGYSISFCEDKKWNFELKDSLLHFVKNADKNLTFYFKKESPIN
jgi:hypothetical protein